NIGPVADALCEALGTDFAVICPAFPAAGRTIYRGHLFVGDVLLSDSGMRDHPLTPMRDSNLVRVLERQTPSKVGLLPYTEVTKGAHAIRQGFHGLQSEDVRYAVVDILEDSHLMAMGEACAQHLLVTGGSGAALGLPENFRKAGKLKPGGGARLPAARGRCAVLSGSCSVTTQKQVAVAALDWPSFYVDGLTVDDSDQAQEAIDWAGMQDPDVPVLIYSTQAPEEVRKVQERFGRNEAGEMIEEIMGRVARGLVAQGVRRFIVAGGETSGAVVKALGISSLEIGPEIDPGIPWTTARGGGSECPEPVALALKSGNFGVDGFFAKAFGMLK
ncbi:MAG: 3-oxo-tetronate kinase, partial [Hyphomicrobiales bacterium]